MIKQMILNRWTGVNLQYPVEDIAEFIVNHSPQGSSSYSQICDCLRQIFYASHTSGNFILLALDQEDYISGVLVVQSEADSSSEHNIMHFATFTSDLNRQQQLDMLSNAMKICAGNLWFSMEDSQVEEGLLEEIGFSPKDSYMYLER